MYKNSLGVFLRSAGMALVLGVVSAMASSCGGNKENNEPEPVKESVEFTQTQGNRIKLLLPLAVPEGSLARATP